jgi:hypothetical protein
LYVFTVGAGAGFPCARPHHRVARLDRRLIGKRACRNTSADRSGKTIALQRFFAKFPVKLPGKI